MWESLRILKGINVTVPQWFLDSFPRCTCVVITPCTNETCVFLFLFKDSPVSIAVAKDFVTSVFLHLTIYANGVHTFSWYVLCAVLVVFGEQVWSYALEDGFSPFLWNMSIHWHFSHRFTINVTIYQFFSPSVLCFPFIYVYSSDSWKIECRSFVHALVQFSYQTRCTWIHPVELSSTEWKSVSLSTTAMLLFSGKCTSSIESHQLNYFENLSLIQSIHNVPFYGSGALWSPDQGDIIMWSPSQFSEWKSSSRLLNPLMYLVFLLTCSVKVGNLEWTPPCSINGTILYSNWATN